MRARSSACSDRRFPWLLWLALLMPLAQAAAAWHALSHQSLAASGKPGGKQAVQPAQCDLCLAVAALGSGAPIGEPARLPPPTALGEAPHAAFPRSGPAALQRLYDSRAPPSTRR
jgi:hypothetical protein